MLRRSLIPAISTRLPVRITAELSRFLAGGHGCVATRPVAPRSLVQAHVGNPRHLERQQVVAGVHTRPAVDDRAIGPVDTKGLEPAPQLFGRLESRVRVEVVDPRGADRARDVALLGVDRLVLSAVALTDASVDYDSAGACASSTSARKPLDLLEVEDARLLRRACFEVTGLHQRDRRLERLAPPLESRVEHGLRAVPEPPQ